MCINRYKYFNNHLLFGGDIAHIDAGEKHYDGRTYDGNKGNISKKEEIEGKKGEESTRYPQVECSYPFVPTWCKQKKIEKITKRRMTKKHVEVCARAN